MNYENLTSPHLDTVLRD